MKIESGNYNITIQFMSRAIDGLNVWDELKNDANSIEIFLGFAVEDGFGTAEGMCIPLNYIIDLYEGLSKLWQNKTQMFSCSKKFPFKDSTDEYFFVSAFRTNEGISFFFKIYDNLCDYVELTEMMSEAKLQSIVTELEEVIKKYPMI